MKKNNFLLNLFSIFIVFSVILLSPYLQQGISDSEPIKYHSEINFNSKGFTSSGPIVILSDSDFANYSLPGNGTKTDPYRIEKLNFTGLSGQCIRIEDTTKYFVIQNCLFTDTTTGIFLGLLSSGTVKIMSNIFSSISHGAIEALYVDSAYVYNNSISEAAAGIYFHYAVNTTICFNTIVNGFGATSDAIVIRQSRLANIYNNTINKCYEGLDTNLSYFIWFFNNTLYNCERSAITMAEVDYSLIAGNDIYNLTNNGAISLYDSTYNEISYNTISNCSDYAIYLEHGTLDNLVHHNNLLYNQHITSQGFDNGINHWSDSLTSEGNHWADWGGMGVYFIDGSGSAIDGYPLLNPVEYNWSKINLLQYPRDDTYEENDDLYQAKSLSLDLDYDLRCLDDDYFILEPIRFYNINISLTFDPTDAFLGIALYNADGLEVDTGHFVDATTKALDYHCINPGVYYLKIFPGGLDSSLANYTLEFDTYPGEILDDILEENDSFETAATIDTTNETYLLLYADFDYFKIDFEEKTNVYIGIAFDNNLADLDLYLLPNDYTGDPADIIAKSETQLPVEAFEFLVNKTDTYIIFVRSIDVDGVPIIPIDYFITIHVLLDTIKIPFIQFIPVVVIILAIAVYRKRK